jgi:hypothetical protein
MWLKNRLHIQNKKMKAKKAKKGALPKLKIKRTTFGSIYPIVISDSSFGFL